MRKLHHWLILWFLLGQQYFTLEALYRFILKGGEKAHIAMLAVGGLVCISIGAVNQIPRFYNSKIIVQAAVGTLITLIIELAAGLILNVWLGQAIWDYTGLPGNILGQISLPFAAIWFFLMPLAIWLEDTFCYYFWGEGECYSLASIYKDFVTFK